MCLMFAVRHAHPRWICGPTRQSFTFSTYSKGLQDGPAHFYHHSPIPSAHRSPSPAFLLDVADVVPTHGGGAHVTDEGKELVL